jgi:hypothetical protein
VRQSRPGPAAVRKSQLGNVEGVRHGRVGGVYVTGL